MTIHPEEAARALRDAEAAAGRSATAFSYDRASPYLILWGLIWMVVNIAAVLRMPYGNVIWPALMSLGIAGSAYLGIREQREGRRRDGLARSLVICSSMLLFALGMGVVVPIRSLANAEAIMGLAIGASYMVMGLATGWRLTAVGAALMWAVILGTIYAREQTFLWMAIAGGGSLILGGLWLRRA